MRQKMSINLLKRQRLQVSSNRCNKRVIVKTKSSKEARTQFIGVEILLSSNKRITLIFKLAKVVSGKVRSLF